MKPEVNEDIPTLLLRVNNIEYKKNPNMKAFGPISYNDKNSSDVQAILHGKILEVYELSLHYMKSSHLYPDEFLRGNKKVTGQL